MSTVFYIKIILCHFEAGAVPSRVRELFHGFFLIVELAIQLRVRLFARHAEAVSLAGSLRFGGVQTRHDRADDCELDTLMDAAEKVMERFPYASIDMRARIGTTTTNSVLWR